MKGFQFDTPVDKSLLDAPPPITDQMRYAAALQICGHATDAGEARRLLDMCGLLHPAGHTSLLDHGTWTTSAVGRLP